MRRLAPALALLLAAGCTADSPDGAGAAGAPDAVEVRTVRDDSTGIALPRVALAGRPEVEARVNAALDSLAASLTCGDLSGLPADVPETDYEARTRVTHAAHDVLSVNVHASYYCGGPYPTNDANRSVTYDLTTGEAVPFWSLFREGEADRTAVAGVLETTLAPAAAGVDAGCADALTAEALATATIAYALTDTGVLVQPQFPHVIEACAVESEIPYGSLRAFARDGNVLTRVADAAR